MAVDSELLGKQHSDHEVQEEAEGDQAKDDGFHLGGETGEGRLAHLVAEECVGGAGREERRGKGDEEYVAHDG
jgi:hypothetical protein